MINQKNQRQQTRVLNKGTLDEIDDDDYTVSNLDVIRYVNPNTYNQDKLNSFDDADYMERY